MRALGHAAGVKPIALSSVAGEGTREVLFALARVIEEAKAAEAALLAQSGERQPWRP